MCWDKSSNGCGPCRDGGILRLHHKPIHHCFKRRKKFCHDFSGSSGFSGHDWSGSGEWSGKDWSGKGDWSGDSGWESWKCKKRRKHHKHGKCHKHRSWSGSYGSSGCWTSSWN